MTGIQIFLIIVGIVTIVGSFIFSDLFEKDNSLNSDSLAGLSNESVLGKINDVVDSVVDNALDDAIEDRMEKTETHLEKISNEKIMAVNDYSETVLKEINKNHEEVMFLYGMLNHKENEIKNTVHDVEEVKKSIQNLKKEIITKEPKNEKKALTEEVNELEIDKTISLQSNIENNNKDSVKNLTEFRIEVKPENKVVAIKAGNPNSKNNNQKILDLYEIGKSNVEIAKKLGLGIGEVRLVIDLYKNKRR